jgi:acetolactate synthase I/II/III large subunit
VSSAAQHAARSPAAGLRRGRWGMMAEMDNPAGSAYETYEVLVAEAMTQCLLREGIERVFGIPSGYVTPLLDAFHRGGLLGVEGRHEGAAAFMAAAYAQASGQTAIVYTQGGPGTTNALTGMAAAYMDSVPMLLFASAQPQTFYGGNAHQEATGANHSIDQIEIFRGSAASISRPPTAESLVRMVRVALTSAATRRLPSVIETPVTLLTQKVQFEDLPLSAYRSQSEPVDVQGVETICRMLRDARSPAVIVGNRLCHRGAADELVAWCEEQEIACTVVDYAKGMMPEDHPLCLGVLALTGHESVAEYLRSSDLVISIGARLTQQVTRGYDRSLFGNLVQIDDDPTEIGRVLPARLGVVGSVPGTLRALREASRGSRPARGDEVRERVAALRSKYRTYDEAVTRSDAMTTPRALRILREHLPRETLVVSDTGLNAQLLKRHFPVYAKDGFYALYALAPMGSGLPMAHGVQIARPDAVVLSVMGDGALLTQVGDLAIAAQHDLPVIHVVMNNNSYKQVADRMSNWYHHTFGCDLRNPDFAALARSFGVDGYSAPTAEALTDAITQAVARRRPTLIEVPVTGDSFIDIMPSFMKKMYDERYGKSDPEARKRWPLPRTRG